MIVSEPAEPRLLYLDSSAIVKLIVREPETTALFKLLRRWPSRTSSVVAKIEVQGQCFVRSPVQLSAIVVRKC